MKPHKVPETEIELAEFMKQNCYNTHDYSIAGNFIYEGYGLEKEENLFIWYYTERGQRKQLNYFQSEKEAVEFAFIHIKSNKWAKSHRISFTASEKKSIQLTKILQKKEIEYW